MGTVHLLHQLRDNLASYGVSTTARKVGRRVWNAFARRWSGTDHLPRRLHIETTMCCNLACEYCVLRKAWRGERVMTFERFRTLEPWIHGCDAITLSGLAEPLMNPELGECIAFARRCSPRAVIGIMTNATLLTREWCERLVSAGLDTLGFSIDAADTQLNAHLRRGSERADILANIRLLGREKERQGSSTPAIFAIMVLQRRNYRQLPAVVEAVASVGVRRLEVNLMEPFSEELAGEALLAPEQFPGDLADTLEMAAATARACRVNLRLAAFAPSAPSCVKPETPLIMANGDVTACSVLAYDRECFFVVNAHGRVERTRRRAACRVFGNVFQTPFEEIWMSTEYREFRRAVARGAFPPECSECLIRHEIVCVTGDGSPRRAIAQVRALMTSCR